MRQVYENTAENKLTGLKTMKLSRIEPMQTHEPDETKEQVLAHTDIQSKLKSVTKSDKKDHLKDVLSEQTKGGLKRLADFLKYKDLPQNKKQKSPSPKVIAIKAYQSLDLFDLEQTQKSSKLNKVA